MVRKCPKSESFGPFFQGYLNLTFQHLVNDYCTLYGIVSSLKEEKYKNGFVFSWLL